MDAGFACAAQNAIDASPEMVSSVGTSAAPRSRPRPRPRPRPRRAAAPAAAPASTPPPPARRFPQPPPPEARSAAFPSPERGLAVSRSLRRRRRRRRVAARVWGGRLPALRRAVRLRVAFFGARGVRRRARLGDERSRRLVDARDVRRRRIHNLRACTPRRRLDQIRRATRVSRVVLLGVQLAHNLTHHRLQTVRGRRQRARRRRRRRRFRRFCESLLRFFRPPRSDRLPFVRRRRRRRRYRRRCFPRRRLRRLRRAPARLVRLALVRLLLRRKLVRLVRLIRTHSLFSSALLLLSARRRRLGLGLGLRLGGLADVPNGAPRRALGRRGARRNDRNVFGGAFVAGRARSRFAV